MILHCSAQGYTTGVSVSGLCSKDVSYRPVKMSLHPATVKMSLQPPGSVLSVLHHPSTAALQCNKLLCAKFMAEQPYEVFVVVQSVHSCPIGRMLDPKAGFTILLPPIKSHRHRCSLTHYSDRIRSFTKSPGVRSYTFQSLSHQ